MCIFSTIWNYFSPPIQKHKKESQLPSQTEINKNNKKQLKVQSVSLNTLEVHNPPSIAVLNQQSQKLPSLQPAAKLPTNCNNKKYIIQQQSSSQNEASTEQLSRVQLISQQPVYDTMEITIKLLDRTERNVIISRDITGVNLKKYIYDNLSNQLGEQNMTLRYQGVKITKSMRLSSLRLVVGTKIKIIQEKLDIADIPHIIADAHSIDPLTEQQGVARMSCGHCIGRDSMTALIRSLISENKYQIRCPNYDQDNQPCLAVWTFKVCKTIGVFTKAEIIQFQTGLSQNWLKQNAKQCPSCHASITRIGLTTTRVKCPACKFGDFCYFCLNKWSGSNNTFCGNDQCRFVNQFITNSHWNKPFQYTVQGNKKTFLTPQYRSCPHCRTIIEHLIGCKHMLCKSCGKNFCWVCLSVPKDTIWSCGGPYQYCGKVAQVQKVDL